MYFCSGLVAQEELPVRQPQQVSRGPVAKSRSLEGTFYFYYSCSSLLTMKYYFKISVNRSFWKASPLEHLWLCDILECSVPCPVFHQERNRDIENPFLIQYSFILGPWYPRKTIEFASKYLSFRTQFWIKFCIMVTFFHYCSLFFTLNSHHVLMVNSIYFLWSIEIFIKFSSLN